MFGQLPGIALAIFLNGTCAEARAALDEHLGRVALVGVADHQACGIERNFVGEAVDVLPVDADHQVEAVVEAIDRACGDAQQRRRLAAADLRAAGAHHQAVPAGLRGGLAAACCRRSSRRRRRFRSARSKRSPPPNPQAVPAPIATSYVRMQAILGGADAAQI